MFRRMLHGAWMIAVLAAMAVPALAQSPPQKVTFLANYTFHGRDTPYFAGVGQGYFRDAGFDVTIEPTTGSGFVVTAIDSGKAEFGMADPGSVIKGVANGAKVRAFMVFMDATTSGLASLKPYLTPQSLIGARVAAAESDDARINLPIIFRQHGLDPSKIQWIAADPSVYISLLLSGQIDLYTASLDGDMPALDRVVAPLKKTAYFASFSTWGFNEFGYLLITQTDRITEHPDEVKRFAAAVKKSVDYSVAHPREAAEIMVKYNPTLQLNTVLAQWQQSIKAIETPYVKQHGYGAAAPARVSSTINLIAQSVTLPSKPTAQQVFAEGMIAK